ncbi:hypothetical protein HY994_03610 [Candidatus Micrarchaeota archaeon]|nr:hypothetical protein [Candidatus Micrarchaeota archaeon]
MIHTRGVPHDRALALERGRTKENASANSNDILPGLKPGVSPQGQVKQHLGHIAGLKAGVWPKAEVKQRQKLKNKHQSAEPQPVIGKRGQAAIFDGITLLLLASISSALIFSFVSGYGVQQDRVLRSAYILNYMQSVVKASYYVDASTLSKVDNREYGLDSRGIPRVNQLEIYQDLKDDCQKLSKYSGSFSVSELLKRDLAEKKPLLDDKFDGTNALGITAYKCAIKELMKPFWYSGFYYGFDVIDSDRADGQTVQVLPKTEVVNSTTTYSNNRLVTDYPDFLKGTIPVGQNGICASIAQNKGPNGRELSPDVVTVDVPFKVVYVDSLVSPPVRQLRNYALAFCIWHPAQ